MKKIMISSILICLFNFSTSYANSEQNMNSSQTQILQTTLPPNFLKLLSNNELNFYLVSQKQVLHNKNSATLYRFEPIDSIHFGKSHVSFLLDSNSGNLQGFVRLLPEYISTKNQISKEEALDVTKNFLENYAPDLLVNYKNSWIDPHDEKIIENSNEITLTGMKVKCRDLNTGLYFWTIIAPDKSVMVFERDIEWDFIRAGRQTQKWLHDSWLSKLK